MKIAVYTIAKNEEKFVERWYQSMKEADELYVLDTGSTDNTVNKLKTLGVKVKVKKISPWRFDVARNLSLAMVPNDVDICVCTDLDEVFNKGWRKELEKVWDKSLTRCRYVYNWKLDKNNIPIISFYYEKIHSRNNFKWVHPVHEVLEYNGEEKYTITDKIILNHYPDNTKSRGSYLPLLELSVKEEPNNDRNKHYLGREYMYYGKYQQAIDTLEEHLKMPTATWKDERSASMRFIARSYYRLGKYDEATMWYNKAIVETPYLRDPLMEKAIMMYQLNNFKECEKLIRKSLKIKINERSYINEVFTFDHSAYDMLSLIYDSKHEYKKALFYVRKVLKISPNDERLKNNYEIMKQELANVKKSKTT